MTNLHNSDQEIWLPISGFESKYSVSSFGRVKSIERIAFNGAVNHILKGRILKPHPKNNGYLTVSLCANGRAKSYHVHRLVASAFLTNPENKPQVNHIDGNTSNNRIDNLGWVTSSENHVHSYINLNRPGANTGRFGKLNGKSKRVKMIRNGVVIKIFDAVMEAARELNVREGSIRSAIYGKSHQCKGHKWEYATD